MNCFDAYSLTKAQCAKSEVNVTWKPIPWFSNSICITQREELFSDKCMVMKINYGMILHMTCHCCLWWNKLQDRLEQLGFNCNNWLHHSFRHKEIKRFYHRLPLHNYLICFSFLFKMLELCWKFKSKKYSYWDHFQNWLFIWTLNWTLFTIRNFF